MRRFLGRSYSDRPVAVNDIGAVTWLSDNRLVDLVGLGTLDVVKAKMARSYDSAAIGAITRKNDVRIAILYASWFSGQNHPSIRGKQRPRLPASWIKVATWKITGNVVCASDEVAFYATSNAEAEVLKRNLEMFSHSLPAGIAVRITTRDAVPTSR